MNPSLKRFSFNAMGGFCEIQLYDVSRINARHLVRQLADEVRRLERKYSRFRPDSLVTEINRAAGDRLGIRLDRETVALFDHALSCFEQSGGLFDISAGVLSRVWDFRAARVPTQAEIDALLPRVGLNKLSWKNSRLHLPRGMEIDFGGIVKEYAADAVARLGRRLGIEHGLVNLGGDFAVIGPQPGQRAWTVGVADPRQRGRLIARIDLLQGGLASSGDYERFFLHQGKRYSHILNPRTGWPCAGLRAASVAAELCTVAGSVATIALLKEQQAGLEWLRDSALPHVAMTQEEEIRGEGLREQGLQEENPPAEASTHSESI